MNTLASELKRIRIQKHFSEDELSKALKIPKETLLDWENGTDVPTLEQFQELCIILQISADYLLKINVQEISSFDAKRNQYKAQFLGSTLVFLSLCIYSHFITVLNPAMIIGENGEILRLYDILFWKNNNLYPLLLVLVVVAVYSAVNGAKYLIYDNKK